MDTAFSVFIAPDLWNAVDVFMENPRGMRTEYRVGDTFTIVFGEKMEPIDTVIDVQREVNTNNSAEADDVALRQEPTAFQSSTVYTLRIDVTVPQVDGQPEYSPDEIVNRVGAALRSVPGDCVVTHQELWRVGPQTIEVFGEFGFGKKVEE